MFIGFNRTGFLICAYLYERESLSIEMAVKEFADCRPNGIYKQHYLDDLKKRYGDDDEDDKDDEERDKLTVSFYIFTQMK